MTHRFNGGTVPARIGDCMCPGKPHPEGDFAYLLPRLTFDGGAAAADVINELIGSGDSEGTAKRLAGAYLAHQVAGWNIVDDTGSDVPFDPALLMTDWLAAKEVANKADDLYSEALLSPLVAAVSTSSAGGRTAPSTSPKTPSAGRRKKR